MNRRSVAGDYSLIMVGTLLVGFAIKSIYDPVSMVTGGTSGLAITTKELWSVLLWLANILLDILLSATGLYAMGWKFIKRTLLSTVVLSVSLYVLPEASYMDNNILLSALLGGIIGGVGTGMVFLASCITGGTDMLVALIQKRMKHYTLAQIMQVLDGIIMLAGAAVFGIPTALYALIAIFYASKVTDGLIEGLKFSKQVYIISDSYREIVDTILERTGRGVTSLEARGIYSDEEKKILFYMVPKKEVVKIREIVSGLDARTSIIMSDAREVFGEGFIEY